DAELLRAVEERLHVLVRHARLEEALDLLELVVPVPREERRQRELWVHDERGPARPGLPHLIVEPLYHLRPALCRLDAANLRNCQTELSRVRHDLTSGFPRSSDDTTPDYARPKCRLPPRSGSVSPASPAGRAARSRSPSAWPTISSSSPASRVPIQTATRPSPTRSTRCARTCSSTTPTHRP